MSSRGAGSEAGIYEAIADAAGRAGARAWLVGGAVRDLLLARKPLDVDVALEGGASSAADAVAILSTVPGWRCRTRHAAFGTATLEAPDGTRVDLAVTREETYAHPGALPTVTPGTPIARDLSRRDFTIHAMALPLGPGGLGAPLLDPFGGETDLRRRLVRLLHDDSLADDPTRAFRAARYAARLGFELDAGVVPAAKRAVASGALARISGDRLRRTLEEVLSEENRDVAIRLLARLGILPAVVDGWEVGEDAVRVLAGAAGTQDAWARLFATLPASTRARLADRLRFSRALRRATGSPS